MARRDEIKAGIVIAVSLLVLAGLILGVSGVSLWERYDQYTVRLRSTTGLDVGTPVRLGGLKVGKILRLAVPPDDRSRVEITLGVRQGTLIPQGTWATVATVGLLGDPFLQLSPETNTTQAIPPGSRIPSREAVQIGELVQQLSGIAGTADTLMVEATTILKSDVRDLLRRIGDVAKDAQGTIAHIDAFVSPANSRQVSKILAEADQLVQETAALMRSVQADITATARRLETTLGAAEKTLGAVEKTADTADAILGENREDIRDAVRFLKRDLDRAEGLIATIEQTLHDVDRTVGNVDHILLGNSEALAETMANLRRSTQNLREFTQELKERPWHVIFPPNRPEKPGLDTRPRAETTP